MPDSVLAPDYLVIGAGGVAMAFVDTLLSESDATVVMVDRRHRAGGHWNDAYPFVRLHQPSAYYGVASRELSSWTLEATGPNAGMYGLAGGAEVLAHFDAVMHERFLASGRVTFLSRHEYAAGREGTHRATSLTSGAETVIRPRRKVVDATLTATEIPARRPPTYAVAPGVTCVPPNQLPEQARAFARYTVVGAGKTGIDTVLWLIAQGVPPARIRWIMPRDPWLLDRANFQPGIEHFETTSGYLIDQFEAIAAATSLDGLLGDLERRGVLMRIDETVTPRMYHCAVVSRGELALLRQVGEIVRLGRLTSVAPDRLVLERGTVPAEADTLYVDCSACAIPVQAPRPVFAGDRINLQMVRVCQPLFSAAVIAWVEAHVADSAQQNQLCRPVPPPDVPRDWVTMWAATLANMGAWRAHASLDAWLRTLRLNSAATMLRGAAPGDARVPQRLQEVGAASGKAAARMPGLLAGLPA